MVTNRTVLARISNQWPFDGLFDADWANIVGSWCVKHYRKYGTAPGRAIEAIFEGWAGDVTKSDEKVESVEKFLSGLSSEYERNGEALTADYLLDLAADVFNKARFEKVLKGAQEDLERGFLGEAIEKVNDVRKVELGLDSYLEPAESFEAWDKAFDRERRRPLVTYPGRAGKFFGDSFVRGEFYAFLAPDKSGKTTYLIDFTYRAVRRRNRVAYFECGDGDQDEVLERLALRSSRQPLYTGEYKVPVEWKEDGLVQEEQKMEGVDVVDAFRNFKKVCKAPDAFRLSCHTNSTISVEQIDNLLGEWERDAWIPDVVVIDYADILAPPIGAKDVLEQIDQTWKQLRHLSQKRHCLVLTATQANSGAYRKEKFFLGPEHFSGRKTKNAHVNGIVGINVTQDERKMNCGPLNWVVKRKRRGGSLSFVEVAGCFDIGNPIIVSR